ncbi:hypothetical protein H5410_063110, partial [Solanum commersonii]
MVKRCLGRHIEKCCDLNDPTGDWVAGGGMQLPRLWKPFRETRYILDILLELDIPAATIGVDGETTVRNVHVEAPLSFAGIDFFGSYSPRDCLQEPATLGGLLFSLPMQLGYFSRRKASYWNLIE